MWYDMALRILRNNHEAIDTPDSDYVDFVRVRHRAGRTSHKLGAVRVAPCQNA